MGHSYWPLCLLIASNLLYQSCAKCSSRTAHPFVILTVVYLIAAAGSLALFLLLGRDADSLAHQLRELNCANYLLGLAIIGLEGGFLYLYRTGWNVSVGPICSYTGVALGLLVLGALCFGEHITLRQVAGTLLALGGIALISWK